MKKSGFTLIELLIVVAIVATLVGVAMPFFENYVKDTKLAKAKHELDIIKEALIKYETIEDRKFIGSDPTSLIGKYLQNAPIDPWGRAYLVNSDRGLVMTTGPDSANPSDDIVVDYKSPLTLQKAVWVDSDNSQYVSASDVIRIEFSRMLRPSTTNLRYSRNPADANADLFFSSDVDVNLLVATFTPASTTFILIPVANGATPNTFYPGSSTVRIASSNDFLRDASPNLFGGKAGRPANGTLGQYPGLDIVIQGN